MITMLRKAFLVGIFCVLSVGSAMAADVLQPFVLAYKTTGDVSAVASDVKGKLTGAGFEIVGEYSPFAGADIIVVTNDTLKANAAKSDRGGYGAAQRVAVTKNGDDVEVSYTNPVYMAAAYRMAGDLAEVRAKLEGALVCRQAEPGLEVIVGALIDQTFGPTVMFGLGGIYTEILQDVSFRIAPFRKWDASKMIREIRGYPLLAGARGSTAIDFDALENLLVSVSNLISEQPHVCELDLNPVRLYPQGLLALDARVLVSACK